LTNRKKCAVQATLPDTIKTHLYYPGLLAHIPTTRNQRRRLVINIGGQTFGSQILGGKNLGKIYFQTTFSKFFLKNPSILKNF